MKRIEGNIIEFLDSNLTVVDIPKIVSLVNIEKYLRGNNLPDLLIKVGLSPSKKAFFICFNDSPSKMMKNAFYFILKALFVLKIFKFFS